MNQSTEPAEQPDSNSYGRLCQYVLAMEYRLAIKLADSLTNQLNLTILSPGVRALSKQHYRFLMLHIQNEKEIYAEIVRTLNDPTLTKAQREHMHHCIDAYYCW